MNFLKSFTWKHYLFYFIFTVFVISPHVLALNRAIQQGKDLDELLALLIIIELEQQNNDECLEETFPDD